MQALIVTYLPWLLSVITIASMLMAGNKHRHAWSLALAGQFLWLLWILASHSWGLIPMNLALWVVYARNHFQWKAYGRRG